MTTFKILFSFFLVSLLVFAGGLSLEKYCNCMSLEKIQLPVELGVILDSMTSLPRPRVSTEPTARIKGMVYVVWPATGPCLYLLLPKAYTIHVYSYLHTQTSIGLILSKITDSVAPPHVGAALGGYLGLHFCELEYLVTLSTVPHYTISVWCWKTGDWLAQKETNYPYPEQILKSTQSLPMAMCHIAVNSESETLVIWNMNVSGKRCLLRKTEIDLNGTEVVVVDAEDEVINMTVKPCDNLWSPEGILHICDLKGNVYSADTDTKMIKLVIPWLGETGDQTPCFVWFKGGIAISGPSSEVKLMRRNVNDWSEVWSLTPKHPILALKAIPLKDYLIGVTERGELMQWNMSLTEPAFDRQRNYGCGFIDFCLINPVGEYIVTLGALGAMLVWQVETGDLIASIPSVETITAMTSSPAMPYIVLGKASGQVQYINMYLADYPKSIALIPLTKEPINNVKFTTSGKLLVAASMHAGQFFAIKGQPGERIEVQAFLEIKHNLVQFIIIEQAHDVLLYALINTTNLGAGNRIVYYTLSGTSRTFKPSGIIETVCMYIGFCINPLGKRDVYAKPHKSRQLQVLRLPMMANSAKIMEAGPSGHQFKKYGIFSSKHHLLTYGLDGLAILHKADTREVLAVLMPHHRSFLGVKKALVDPLGVNVISLGENKTLTCTNVKLPPDTEKVEECQAAMQSSEWRAVFIRRKTSLLHEEDTKNWLELQADAKRLQEKCHFGPERTKIGHELNDIREQTVALLQANDGKPPEEQLPVSAFYLDREKREKLTNIAKQEREDFVVESNAVCDAQDELHDKIQRYCWEKMEVKGKCIKAIFGVFNVENYALHPLDVSLEEQVKWLTERRKVEVEMSKGDQFFPWVPASVSTLQMQLAQGPHVGEIEDQGERIREALMEMVEEDQEAVTIKEKQESPYVFSGSTSHNFIEITPYHYPQMEISTYNQVYDESILLKKVSQELQLFFNRAFNETLSQKEREMNLVGERNARLRYILSELKDYKTFISEPYWHPHERPWSIITVEDSELPIGPYISPSRQLILDKLAAEEEARRLAELADNFRERALIEMMDGVLEVRWEDIIKKDIPLPKCMIEKQPENWNEEDLRSVNDYEEKVKFLMSERERYRKMLEAEFKKLQATLKESVGKFDERLAELYLLKLKVESSISHENLKGLRARLQCQSRIALDEAEDKLKNAITTNDLAIENTVKEIQKLHEVTAECRAAHESLATKEKNLDKNFRRDFPDLSPIIIDQLLKAYKRRPKLSPKAVTSATMVNEMGRCALTNERPLYLPHECIDFIKGLDVIDQVTNAPTIVHEETWFTLCRVRRIKIECELKIKAAALEVAEAELTVSIYHKYLVHLKEKHNSLQADLQAIRKKRLEIAQNKEIQIVMKQGLVEVALTGALDDFYDAILVKRFNVEVINKIIQRAGRRKLRIMHEAANFRRHILCMEWEHKTMIMQIEDLRVKLRAIKRFKLIKEVQAYLRRRYQGLADDVADIAIVEKEFQAIKEYYERLFREKRRELSEIEEKINTTLRDNNITDIKIHDLNVDVNEQELRRDFMFEGHASDAIEERVAAIMQRSRMCSKIQSQHSEILVLQTELELLRLKTYPTLKYSTLS